MQVRSGGFFKTLSGRFLILTAAFVMLAEVLIFLPSIARFRLDFLTLRLEKSQIASLSQLAAEDMIMPELERELLANAEVYNVVLRRDEARQLVLSSPLPSPIDETFDLRNVSAWTLISDALRCLAAPSDRVIRVIGEPWKMGGILIEVTMDEAPLRHAMIDYGLRILALSAFISVITAVLLFLSVQRLMVAPIRRLVQNMQSYAEVPEDARRFIAPTAKVLELRTAEEAMEKMQHQLTGALRQKERLAQLGQAVAKISHDLRNILTTAQLFADRIEASEDPLAARIAPKLVGSITRAVDLCEATLSYGKAEEPPPKLRSILVEQLLADVTEAETLSSGPNFSVKFQAPKGLAIRADGEQMYRVLSNLIRNARQAIDAAGRPGEIDIEARDDTSEWQIRLSDNGPGLPPKAREHLFEAFQGNVRKGGTGLGLAIASELVRGHGGRLVLDRSDAEGTQFSIHLPKPLDIG